MAGRKDSTAATALKQVKDVFAMLTSRKTELVDARAARLAERAPIANAPRTREEVIADCERRIDSEGEFFRAALDRMIAPVIGGSGTASLDLLRGDRHGLAGPDVSGHMLGGLLGPVMCQAVRDYVNSIEEWPEGALSDAERAEKLKPIDAEIDRLTAELDELNSEISKLQAVNGAIK